MVMELVADSRRLVALDLVEVNPTLDIRNTTAEFATELALSALGKGHSLARAVALTMLRGYRARGSHVAPTAVVSRRRIIAGWAQSLALVGVSTWLFAAEGRGALPAGHFDPHASPGLAGHAGATPTRSAAMR